MIKRILAALSAVAVLGSIALADEAKTKKKNHKKKAAATKPAAEKPAAPAQKPAGN